MFNNILVCSDGSEHALEAARAAAEIAKKFGSHVTLVHVFLPMGRFSPDTFESGRDKTALTPEYTDLVQQSIEKHTGKVFDDAGVDYAFAGATGQVVEQIVRLAEQENAALIVLGSRGRGGFQRFLLGSTSDGVAHHAHCPVLIVR